MEINQHIKEFVNLVINDIKAYESFLNENSTDNKAIKTTVAVKDSGTSYGTYKGPDGRFRVSVDNKTMKIVVQAMFGNDKYEVRLSNVEWIEKGIRPVFHPFWSVFNTTFSKIKNYSLD